MILHKVAYVYRSCEVDFLIAKEKADVAVNANHKLCSYVAPVMNDSGAVYQSAYIMSVAALHHSVKYYFLSNHLYSSL